MTYSEFRPPFRRDLQFIAEWPRVEAERLFTWLMDVKQERVAHLLRHFGQANSAVDDTLRYVGNSCVEIAELGGYSQKAIGTVGLSVSYELISICIDTCLYIAESIANQIDEVEWRLMDDLPDDNGSPPYALYQHPVLTGFPGIVDYSPLSSGRVMAHAIYWDHDRDRAARQYLNLLNMFK